MKTSAAQTAIFGPYSLDLRSGELRKLGTKVKMGEQSFRILCLLLDAKGEMVTREELRTKLWAKDTFVDFDHGLNSAVQRLRDSLSDSADNPRWIETVPRRGYRFVGQVEWQEGNGASSAPAHETEPSPTLEASAAAPQPAPRTRHTWALAVAILILVVAGLAIAYRAWKESAKRQAARMIRSLAVLPLENLSGDPTQDYFADGMTDELITVLAKNGSLRVVSRTSVMQYKGVHRPLRDIASELGVDGILEGSVARSAGRIHLNVQLIYAPTDTHVWAESYDRDSSQAYLLPEQLSQTVAREVRTATSPAPPQRYINPEAHDAYLRGRYLWFNHDHRSSREYFEKAIQIQPDYAAAWSGLADSYAICGVWGDCTASQVSSKGESAARKAVELDASLPEAHNSLAGWYLFYAWDLPRAEIESKRSLELNPNFAEGHHMLSFIFAATNRLDESLSEQKRSTELDPYSRNSALGFAYLQQRKFEAAINDLRLRARVVPSDFLINEGLFQAYWLTGKWKEAEQEYEKELEIVGWPEGAQSLRHAFEAGGAKAIARFRLDDIAYRARKSYVPPIGFASGYACLGDKDKTMRYLEESFRVRTPWLIMVESEPMFDFVHSESRYQALIKKMGLPIH